MQVNCPNCTRPVETSKAVLTGPAQTIRCQWCGNHFAMHGGNPITTGEFRKIKQDPALAQTVAAGEVWEFDAGDEPAAPAGGSILDDMDLEFDGSPADPNGLMLYPTEDLSTSMGGENWEDTPDALPAASEAPLIPDLPSAPAPVSDLVERLADQSWSEASVDLDGDVPELPDFGDMQFQDASPTQPPPALEPLPEMEPEPATPGLRTGPPPAIEESIDDLLGDFISDDGRGEELILRFYIRRNRKDYGPFTEEEVHSLLESRKLTGDEMSRLQNDKEWMPLRERPDFKPTISILEKQAVRVGWDGQTSAPPPPPPAPELPQHDIPTLNLSDLEDRPDLQEAFDMSDVAQVETDAPVVVLPEEAQPKRDLVATLTDVRFLGGLAIGLLLIVAGLWLTGGKKTNTNKKTKTKRIFAADLALDDNYTSYRALQIKLTESFRKRKFDLLWYKVRFLYYMLDSHGDDRAIRADIKPLTLKLLKRKSGAMSRRRLQLARALSLRDKQKIQDAFEALKTPLEETHREWGYLLARTKELTGQHKEANTLYKALLAKHNRHVRARLGLFRTYKALNREKDAAQTLFRASRMAPKHMPTQLVAVDFATKTGRWDTQVPKMLIRIKRQVRAQHYTQSSLAKWKALLAGRHWEQRRMDKAIENIESATTLAPNDYKLFFRKVQYYRWSRQHFSALRAIKKKPKWRLQYPSLLFVQFAILRESRQKHKIEPALNALQNKAVTAAQKSAMYTLLGDYYLAQHRERDAARSYQKAEKERGDDPSPPYGKWALIRLMLKEKQWKQAEALLVKLRETTPIAQQTRELWGELLFRQKRYKKALQEANILKSTYHSNYFGYLLTSRIYRRTVGLQKAITALRRALYYHQERPSRLLLTLSDLYLELDKPSKSLRSLRQFEKLLQSNPSCPFLERKAQVLRQMGLCRELLKLKGKRCKRFPLHLAQGNCAEKLKRKGKALRAYKYARMIAPEALEPLEALANYHKKEGNLAESTRLFNILNRKRPSDKSNLLSLVRVYEGRQLYVLALKQILQRRHIFKGDFDVELARARLEGTMHRTKRALRQLRKLRRKAQSKKQKAELAHAFGRTYARDKKLRTAVSHYRKAIGYLPKKASLYLELGTIYYRQKKFEECQDMAKKFLSNSRRRDPQRAKGKALKKACGTELKNP